MFTTSMNSNNESYFLCGFMLIYFLTALIYNGLHLFIVCSLIYLGNQDNEHILHQQQSLYVLNSPSLAPLCIPAPETTGLLWHYILVVIFYILYKWNHTDCILLILASFMMYRYFVIHPCCVHQLCVPLLTRSVLLYGHSAIFYAFIYLLVDIWVLPVFGYPI